ncbi:DUF4283 domain-containing protein [Cephalotus follicularis]|uniref:DUF4283 domain-containing protein n=1 Tax=Cephalotus follicularis TaxID=3775 RepID=A0A1Q3BXB8_CEPFO|nr:DUF4283 domain-containing protein [Cephalotus follicularis]
MWKLSGELDLLDLGHGYFVAKFDSPYDCSDVLIGGPWLIFGHCLLVQPWRPYFKPSIAPLSSLALWVRLPELLLEFYDESLLFAIGGLIGKPLRLDKNTALATKTGYARLCVEVDLTKTLIC